MGARADALRLTARQWLLGLFVITTLALLGAGLLVANSLLSASLYRTTEQDAGREARLVADMGLAGALSTGSLSRRDLRLAATEYDVARTDVPLTGVSLWTAAGAPVFAAGSGRADIARLPRLAWRTLATGRTEVADTSLPGSGSVIEAAVPLRAPALRAVVDFHFSRAAVERSVARTNERLYLLTAIAALILFFAVLPLLAWLVRRVPLPEDPAERAAAAELRAGLDRRELVLHYQPKIDLETGRVLGVEALVRWNHPRRGLLPPAEFLPVAERHVELLRALTWEVLECAIAACARWRSDGHELPVAVNVPAALLTDGQTVPMLTQALARHRLEPRMVTVELTESALMEQPKLVAEPLAELRALGAAISIDDFGTGHSSLARLRTLPLDELKVDRSFIAGIAGDERDLGIARLIVALGLHLGLRVVAEGVEDEPTLRLLRAIGCTAAQGFLYTRPLPEEQLRMWFVARRRLAPARAPATASAG